MIEAEQYVAGVVRDLAHNARRGTNKNPDFVTLNVHLRRGDARSGYIPDQVAVQVYTLLHILYVYVMPIAKKCCTREIAVFKKPNKFVQNVTAITMEFFKANIPCVREARVGDTEMHVIDVQSVQKWVWYMMETLKLGKVITPRFKLPNFTYEESDVRLIQEQVSNTFTNMIAQVI